MSKRTQLYLLGALTVLLALSLFYTFRQAPQVVAVFANQSPFKPIDVQDPTLRVFSIQKLQEADYTGTNRNIFQYGAAPRQQQQVVPDVAKPDGDAPAPADAKQGPPALTVPFKFYGTVANTASGRLRAFFTNGEDIWIAEEGGMIDRRFRLVKIGNSTAEVEEVSSGRKTTLPLEEDAGSGK